MTEKTLASPKPSEIPIANNFKKVFRQYGGILSGMVVLIILFSFINDSFFTANNITNIILQVSIIAITAYGMTCIDWHICCAWGFMGNSIYFIGPIIHYCSPGSGDDKWWLDGYSGDPVVYCHRCYYGDLPWYRLYSDRWYAHHD